MSGDTIASNDNENIIISANQAWVSIDNASAILEKSKNSLYSMSSRDHKHKFYERFRRGKHGIEVNITYFNFNPHSIVYQGVKQETQAEFIKLYYDLFECYENEHQLAKAIHAYLEPTKSLYSVIMYLRNQFEGGRDSTKQQYIQAMNKLLLFQRNNK